MPFSSINSSCVPCSTIAPSSTTQILSAFTTVLSRCATITKVQFFSSDSRSIAACTSASLSASNDDVASSSSITLGCDINMRAILMRCFWPPEQRLARVPIFVPYVSSISEMNLCALASLAEYSTCSRLYDDS
mmetsp:Transcript_15669/g.23973  ORF Transcript_15669/g.23973 Transcript_15669/m.23973 type:complete len:133 (+) Transcript_15669:31-429(+)